MTINDRLMRPDPCRHEQTMKRIEKWAATLENSAHTFDEPDTIRELMQDLKKTLRKEEQDGVAEAR